MLFPESVRKDTEALPRLEMGDIEPASQEGTPAQNSRKPRIHFLDSEQQSAVWPLPGDLPIAHRAAEGLHLRQLLKDFLRGGDRNPDSNCPILAPSRSSTV